MDVEQLEIEKEIKEVIANCIEENNKAYMKTIEIIRNVVVKLEDVPKIWTCVNNKIVELSRKFERSGISFYSSKINDDRVCDDEIIVENPLGAAIVLDLFAINLDTIKDFCDDFLEFEESRKKGISKIFVMKQENKKYVNCLETVMGKLLDVNDEIFDYELNDENVIRAVTGYFSSRQYTNDAIIGLTDNICEQLDKLELGHIKSSLSKEVKSIFKNEKSFFNDLKVENISYESTDKISKSKDNTNSIKEDKIR